MFLRAITITAILLASQTCLAAVLSAPSTLGFVNDSYFEAGNHHKSNHHGTCRNGKKQAKCTWDKKGNVITGFGDGKFNYGNISPGKIIQSIKSHCYPDNTCDPDWELDTIVVPPGKPGNAPPGAYGKVKILSSTTIWNPGHLGHLLDGLRGAMHSFQKVEKRPGLFRNESCPLDNHGTCSPYYIKRIKQHIGTKQFSIQVTPKHPSKVNHFETMGFIAKLEISEGTGLCKELFTIGGAIAGAFSGPLSSSLTLLGMTCSL